MYDPLGSGHRPPSAGYAPLRDAAPMFPARAAPTPEDSGDDFCPDPTGDVRAPRPATSVQGRQLQLLERQLAFFRNLARGHGDLLAQVFDELTAVADTAPGAALEPRLQQRCRALRAEVGGVLDGVPATAAARRGMDPSLDSDDDALAKPRDPKPQGLQGAATATAEGLERAVAAGCEAASLRIVHAASELFNAWADTARRRVDEALATPVAAFQHFHDEPTEANLDAFFDDFRAGAEAARATLVQAEAATAAAVRRCEAAAVPATTPAPVGSPFVAEAGAKVAGLFQRTVADAVGAHVREVVTVAPTSQPQPQPQPQPEPSQAASAAVPAAVADPVPRDPAPAPLHGNLPPSVPRGRSVPGVPGVGAARTPGRRAVSTPATHRGASNDSSSVGAILGGVPAPAPTPRAQAALADPSVDPEQLEGADRVAYLQATLHQLELHLATVAGHATRSNGSEARFYALSRKLSRVRAELLREQKKQQEVARLQHEAVLLQRRRDDHRRAFGR